MTAAKFGPALVAVLALTCAAAACSNGDDGDVATMTQGAESGQAADMVRAGQQLTACLQSHNLPVTIVGGGNSGISVGVEADHASVTCVDGVCVYWGATTESVDDEGFEERMQIEAEALGKIRDAQVAAQGESAPTLVIGDVDSSATLAECLDQSGFRVVPNTAASRQGELEAKQAVFDQTMVWVECVRKHGYSNVRDPEPAKADQWATTPTALLPVSIDLDVLKDLLTACPPVPPAKTIVLDDGTVGEMQGPSVDFFGEDPSEEQTELGQRQAILDEAAAEAWATLPDTASAG